MRGNEEVDFKNVPTGVRFPIPMRGNETMVLPRLRDGYLVPDPHEG